MKYTFTSFVFALLFVFTINAQTKEKALTYMDKDKVEALKQLSQKLEKKFQENYKLAIEKFPEKQAGNQLLYGIDRNGNPIYYKTYNGGSAITIGVNELYQGGSLGLDLSGSGMYAGLWEGGAVRHTHQELTGRVQSGDLTFFTGSDDLTSHATHVAGTIISSGAFQAASKGMAYEASIFNYSWTNDLSEMTSKAAEGMLVSNHSYGLAAFNDSNQLQVPLYYFGKYLEDARDLDEILYNAEYYLPIIAAGNDRDLSSLATNKGGYDMLTSMSTSKNAVVVAAVNEVGNYTSPFSVQMSSFSNYGPTDDGRIKPDISAKGVSVFSLDSQNNDSYSYKSGTSMATPSVTGALLLIQEYYDSLFGSYLKAASLKALMVNSALEAGFSDGPDYAYGWGLMSAKNMAETITNIGNTAIIEENVLNNNEEHTFTFDAVGGQDLVVTIAWTDPQGEVYISSPENMVDYSAPVLVNDLDVRVVKDSNVYFPWTLNVNSPQLPATKADNSVDNIEKIEIENASGNYTVTVSHKGNLTNGAQNYSIVITGLNVSSLLGVEEVSLNDNISIWPNPVKDVLNYSFKPSNQGDVNIKLIDVQGRTLINQQLNGAQSLISGQIQTEKLPKGIYILNISQGNTTYNKKVVLY